jgi:hypothetical protein
LTVKAAGKHPVSFRTRQLSLHTYSLVLWCESPREDYPRKGAESFRLGGESYLIPSGVLWDKLHCLKSRGLWFAVKPPLQISFFNFWFSLLIEVFTEKIIVLQYIFFIKITNIQEILFYIEKIVAYTFLHMHMLMHLQTTYLKKNYILSGKHSLKLLF